MNEDIPWLSYIVLTIVVSFLVAIFTEYSVTKRMQMSEGVVLKAGKCRLKDGYGPVSVSEPV